MKILKKTIKLVCVSFALLLGVSQMYAQSYVDKTDAVTILKEYLGSEANAAAKNVYEPLTVGAVGLNSGIVSQVASPTPDQDILDTHIYIDEVSVQQFFQVLQESTDVSDAVNSYETLHISPLVNHSNANLPKYVNYINKRTQFLNGVKKLLEI